MKKDFQKWHALKSNIEEHNKPPLFREQEIWWCSLGANIGVEEDGKNEFFERPILVLRKFNKEMFWGLPLTSKKKEDKFHYFFILHGLERSAILSQLRLWSSKRLIRRLGKISDKQFISLKDSVMALTKTDPIKGPRVPNGNSSII
ncbi:MAG: type II toxin-antitoxin system PemK/MazF family toxin [bacterium]|nr:type II toxin-antitoxin system PemK/MazF family toxin [bacterium]